MIEGGFVDIQLKGPGVADMESNVCLPAVKFYAQAEVRRSADPTGAEVVVN